MPSPQVQQYDAAALLTPRPRHRLADEAPHAGDISSMGALYGASHNTPTRLRGYRQKSKDVCATLKCNSPNPKFQLRPWLCAAPCAPARGSEKFGRRVASASVRNSTRKKPPFPCRRGPLCRERNGKLLPARSWPPYRPQIPIGTLFSSCITLAPAPSGGRKTVSRFCCKVPWCPAPIRFFTEKNEK